MIVVSDSSPIRALHHLQLLNLCQQLYGTVIVPEAVRTELLSPTTTCPAIDITKVTGFEVRAANLNPIALHVPADLDAGETEAITIALELHADLILMDERKGTQAAKQLGLVTIGVFGILLEAKRRGIIERVLPCVDLLITELRFFVAPALRQRIAELSGE